MFNNNNNYNSCGVPEWLAYGGVSVGIPKGAVPQNATNGAVPQWALGQQNQNSTFGQPTQLAQNNTQVNDGSNMLFSFNDIYYSQNDSSGNTIYKGTADHEGGFSNRDNDLGGATNYGITQSSLNEYNSWNSQLKKGVDFPQDVRTRTGVPGQDPGQLLPLLQSRPLQRGQPGRQVRHLPRRRDPAAQGRVVSAHYRLRGQAAPGPGDR